jgi:Icc-related predicted phosphoesterase
MIHESRGPDMIGRSKIVNPGPAAVGHYARIETDPEILVWLDGDSSPIALIQRYRGSCTGDEARLKPRRSR